MKKLTMNIRLVLLSVSGIISVFLLYQHNNSGTTSFENGTGIIYNIGSDDITSLALTGDDAILYAACLQDNQIKEIDTQTMNVTRTFNVSFPQSIMLSPNESYLYSTSGWNPGQLFRIRLSDGYMDSITLAGEPIDISADPDGSRLWVLHSTWPLPGDLINDLNTDPPPDSAIITEIDGINFAVTQTLYIDPVPISMFYSSDSERIFILHGTSSHEADEYDIGNPNDPDNYWCYDEVTAEWNIITLYDASVHGALRKIPGEIRGGSDFFPCFRQQLETWTDNGNMMAVPNPLPYEPPFSLRVINCDTQNSFDLTFPDANNKPIGCYFIHKVKFNNLLWATSGSGDIVEGADESAGNILIRVDTTSPYSHQAYIIDEVNTHLTDFAVASDGMTLFLTSEDTGQVIVWTPDDLNSVPVCSVSADPTTYTGQDPIDIVFDASGSYDPDQGDVLSYSWDFNGDSTFGDPWDSGTDIQPVKIYSADYEGPVSVRVTDNHNASSTCTVTISVDITVNHPPVCSITANPTTYQGPAPAVINFNASGSYDPDQGDWLTFSWDFNNDGIFGDPYDGGTPESVIKNYTADYNGLVSVRVTDNHGAYTDCSVAIMIDIT